MDMIIISLINQKGGVGKTTTACELASGLVRKGKSVLLIDGDPQGNCSYAAGINAEDPDIKTLKNVFDRTCTIKDCVYRTHLFGAVIPNNIMMASADRMYGGPGSMKILRTALKKVHDWDYCIIDAPPTLGIISWNILIASDYLIIPVNAAAFSIQGLHALADIIAEVKSTENIHLKTLGIVLTRYNARTKLGHEALATLEVIAKEMHTKVFTAKIRQSVQIEVAQAQRKPLQNLSPRALVTKDYDTLVNEVLEDLDEKN